VITSTAGVGEALVSAVLKEVLRELGSVVGEQIKARWKLKKDMESIKSMLELVQALLRDAERRSVRKEAVNLWLKMLKNAAHDISDMLDEFEVKLSQVISRRTFWIRIWTMLSKEEEKTALKDNCRKLETTVLDFFNKNGWNFRNRLQA
ncbi:putative disease resistance RPP13-like protein 3, partial [Setaria viridis]